MKTTFSLDLSFSSFLFLFSFFLFPLLYRSINSSTEIPNRHVLLQVITELQETVPRVITSNAHNSLVNTIHFPTEQIYVYIYI